jgi:hypothetical protein
MKKSLNKISWQVSELSYRADKAISQSLISRYDSEGFECLENLNEGIKTPSLDFGSAVDCLITSGEEEFDKRFYIATTNKPSGILGDIINSLYNKYGDTYPSLNNMPDEVLLSEATEFHYQSTYKDITRINNIKKGEGYYQQLHQSNNKIIINYDTYQEVLQTVHILKNSENTSWYFQPNDTEYDGIERFYQLKFRSTFDNVPYKAMLDLIVVDHNKKEIHPCDLKTTSKKEYLFHHSFLKWKYYHQAVLYSKILEDNLSKDEYFKDFRIRPFKFIVINKYSLTPLIWVVPIQILLTSSYSNNVDIKDTFTLGKELNYYLNNNCYTPKGINIKGLNYITEWLQKI